MPSSKQKKLPLITRIGAGINESQFLFARSSKILNAKRKISWSWLLAILVVVLIVPLAVVLVKRMESTAPVVTVQMTSPALGAEQTVTFEISDSKSGLRQVWIALLKDGQETVLVDKTYPAGNLWAGGTVRQESLPVSFDIRARGLKDGKAMLRTVVRDYAWRNWWHGNTYYHEMDVVIDTRAPEIAVLSKSHNVNRGGAGMVVYKLSEECRSSGVMVGDHFYPGYSGHFKDPNLHLAFFALGHLQGTKTILQVTAVDLAGNRGHRGFNYLIKDRAFKKDTITLSDALAASLTAEFKSQIPGAEGLSPVDLFLTINRKMRQDNYETIQKVIAQTDRQMHWQGDFLRLPRAAPRAGFADHRSYLHGGRKIDEQTHMGVDLASLEQSPVPAANSGKVIFAEYLGIYGRAVMIDHGFGLSSMYAHLSQISVTPGQMVARGEIIGNTGQTGLAGGDHLHFSILVHDTFVNPVEWWDMHWITDNVLAKFDGIQ
jgi:murein DD-endopeptidase MepM/ murein hydrolase activator NlpD